MDILNLIKEREKLTVTNGRILVMPTDQRNFKTFPIVDEDKGIFVDLETYLALRTHYLMFTPDLCGVEEYTPEEESTNGN